jgi:hypothetical protein
MRRESLIFLGWNAYGDFLSYNGMIRFLLNYFDKIYIKADNNFLDYLNDLYNDVLDRVIFVSIDNVINIASNKKTPVLNLIQYVDFDENGVTSIVNADKFQNISLKSIVPSELYFNGDNKISGLLNLGPEYTNSNLDYIDNASNFYTNVGLNPEIRYKYFYYNRLINGEDNLYKELLVKNNISVEEDYIVICDTDTNKIRDEYKNIKYVNIDFCTNRPLQLITLLENAKEIHLIDNSNVLFLYYLQMAGLTKFDNVTIHIYSRNRFEYYYKMFMNPKIESWKIIF